MNIPDLTPDGARALLAAASVPSDTNAATPYLPEACAALRAALEVGEGRPYKPCTCYENRERCAAHNPPAPARDAAADKSIHEPQAPHHGLGAWRRVEEQADCGTGNDHGRYRVSAQPDPAPLDVEVDALWRECMDATLFDSLSRDELRTRMTGAVSRLAKALDELQRERRTVAFLRRDRDHYRARAEQAERERDEARADSEARGNSGADIAADLAEQLVAVEHERDALRADIASVINDMAERGIYEVCNADDESEDARANLGRLLDMAAERDTAIARAEQAEREWRLAREDCKTACEQRDAARRAVEDLAVDVLWWLRGKEKHGLEWVIDNHFDPAARARIQARAEGSDD